VLSVPPHLVRDYLHRFSIGTKQRVLDPFCGTGTTLVECKKLGIPSVGIEANPMAFFASQVKVDWNVDPDGLVEHASKIASIVKKELELSGIPDDALPLFCIDQQRNHCLKTLPDEKLRLVLANSISPLPLHKTLVLFECLKEHEDDRYRRHELVALAKALVFSISNLHFGPEVGVGKPKEDAPVVSSWMANVRTIADDLRHLKSLDKPSAEVFNADAREVLKVLEPNSIDAVITSPPYPNEKDYTRTTRLESVLLGFIANKNELKELKRTLVRSNTRTVYKEDKDDEWVSSHSEIQRIAAEIETRRITLGKTSGFERLYARVAKLYFGGMTRHLADLRKGLRPGAQLAYVVGDQASYLRVMIRTGELLADIAQTLGYEVTAIDLFRTRLATATRDQLREEVVILRWPGYAKGADAEDNNG
jgi:SAM-dependent methyltransferase